ncbi:MAG: homoserine O-acetyltransferase, partial [Actinomycetales bacterium]|nr:homoserine O-acetyltransferase [Actinomycetales bacterium]
LFPVDQSERIASGIPGAGLVHVIRSEHGHDGFLIENDQLGPVVADFLASRVR